jgi:hypothetical protein
MMYVVAETILYVVKVGLQDQLLFHQHLDHSQAVDVLGSMCLHQFLKVLGNVQKPPLAISCGWSCERGILMAHLIPTLL